MDRPRFNGPEYKTKEDHERLTRQHERVREAMRDGEWRTLDEIAALTGDPVASVSAQLRHLRKPRFGSWNVDRRSVPRRDGSRGALFEYRLRARDEEATHAAG
jgi:hypothetical protein